MPSESQIPAVNRTLPKIVATANSTLTASADIVTTTGWIVAME